MTIEQGLRIWLLQLDAEIDKERCAAMNLIDQGASRSMTWFNFRQKVEPLEKQREGILLALAKAHEITVAPCLIIQLSELAP